ncbi:GGDEF domain-containing protein [Paenibacillus sp. NPDC058174]|uniref:GGDEF domain-containing protein n=1 Tax=Paenibacillus sp. NPDC058174 TaxID=3346366 RepID=UPI0036DC2995
MDNKIALRNVDIGYVSLIVLLLAEQLAVYLNLYLNQSFTGWQIGASVGALVVLAAGFFIPAGFSVVFVFLFIVTYLVWLTTYGSVNILETLWLLFIPANILIATFVKYRIIRTKHILERLNALSSNTPMIDLDTGLGNKEALADTLTKQANLANRYGDKYDFSIAMFKIDFLPLVLESLGNERYSKFIIEIADTIQRQIRHEDTKFSIDAGRFIIVCPLTDRSFFPAVTDRIKNAMININFEDKRGQPLQLVVRAAILGFEREQFDLYQHVDDVIATLERGTETDLVAEYI